MRTYKILFLEHRSQYLNSLGDSLAQLGHEIFIQTSWAPAKIDAALSYFKPDIIITIGCGHVPICSPYLNKLHELCRKYGLFHINWAIEDKIHHTYWSIPYIKRIKPDLVWTIHPDCVNNYEKLGIPSSYLNFSFNPRMFPEKKYDTKEPLDISFVGSTHLRKRTYRYDSLQQLLFPLIKARIKTHIWGSGWNENLAFIRNQFGVTIPRDWIQGFLPYEYSASIYHSSKIVLGVQNAEDQVSQRTFEILGTGSFMIASKTKAITKMFKDKKEIVATSSPEETIELVNYYLKQPEVRHKLGYNARQKILNKYTFYHQLNKIWPKVDKLIAQKKELNNTIKPYFKEGVTYNDTR